MSIKNKLNRLKNHIVTESAAGVQMTEVSTDRPKTGSEGEGSPFKAVRYGDDFCLLREVVYPLDHLHGIYRLEDCAEAVREWNKSKLNHPLSAAGHRPEDLFFFDTETTGLGGGTGNMIFLLGHASFTETGVIVRQHLLPKPGNEAAFYKSFLGCADISTLVTYNGKSFDWPQVKTRHTMLRNLVPELPSFGHFDLYHASRRLWKHRNYPLKLVNVESEILGIYREDDVPGYLAPIIYQHYVQTGDEAVLEGIMKHNELDVLTLITLYTHLSRKLLSAGTRSSMDEGEQYEVARWYENAGEKETALNEYEDIAEKGSEWSLEAKLKVADHLKKEKQWEKAASIWKDISAKGSGKLKTEACVQLAMYFEHTVRELETALEWTEEAMTAADDVTDPGNAKKSALIMAALNKRKLRIEGKLLGNYSPGKRRK
ncbi:ribonuclease H-like domain-containing protein [Metabacillus sp. 113a]|uniref:ribonuclease H-like domain-containing protein n=1 Tax=Metabacillus sp. 113a TaxID=3404706 RepID=UPI003CF6D6B8